MQNDTCYILALIKRDDGERLLLGSGFYEFTKEQKHFNPNLFANDVVELQGADGQLLAGQVRRSTAQSFDGYIGDGTTNKQIVEQKRREFFLFFRKQHHYTVVYIMPDGTAIKRDRGYIVDAPAVQELYQVQPKWHISLAFEDVNYYSYAEDSQGQEIYAFSADLNLASVLGGGLKWDENGAISTPTGLGNIRIYGDTFQQSYDGGNLFSGTIELGSISSTTGEDTTVQNRLRTTGLTSTGFGGKLSITATNAGQGTLQCAPRFYRADGSYIGNGGISWLDLPATVTPIADAAFIRLIFRYSSDIAQDPSNIQDLQIKAPAAPNPDFPQPVKTVTGEQTITINGTDYPLNLGTIELCKLGGYQDYIWKDGEDWKVHKANNRLLLNGTEEWRYYQGVCQLYGIVDYATADNAPFCEAFRGVPNVAGLASVPDSSCCFINVGGSTTPRFYVKYTELFTGDTAIKAWLASNNQHLYYALATPTDTVITDATLIAQLNAIEEAMGADGKPTAIVPTGDNLAAIITGEPNGTGGYEWEASEGGGPSFITVEGVDDALPVWHVVGPATNPTLTNSSNGLSITWNGTVPAGQELIVDMGAQTATMEGANVFQYISGSWLTLSPGTNRIAYTAANTTAGSKIYWNEIVG